MSEGLIQPQPGPQTKFLACPADICVFGGGAGGTKTYSLFMEGGRNITVKGSRSIFFRRETTQLRDGGMWDDALPLFLRLGCRTNATQLRFDYPGGGFLKFSHLQHEKNKLDHQGKQYSLIGFDELTHFSETMFFYLLSRNRSTVISPYMRGTCNPDPDSFLVNGKEGWGSGLISWWIDDEGYAIPERDGVIRYMYRSGDNMDWDQDMVELIDRHYDEIRKQYDLANEGLPDGEVLWSWSDYLKHAVKSVTFIKSSVHDNKELLRANPEYLANLASMDPTERARLLDGNWKTKAEGSIFKRDAFDYYDGDPYLTNIMIFADTAQSTKDTAAYTVYMLVGKNPKGFYILDVLRDRLDADDLLAEAVNFWRRHSKPVNSNHPPRVFRIENKSSGIGLNQQLRNRGIPIEPVERSGKRKDGEKMAGSKWERATNAMYAMNGRKILLPRAPTKYTHSVQWVEPLISECLSAEKHGDDKGFWDQVDTLSDAITEFYLEPGDLFYT